MENAQNNSRQLPENANWEFLRAEAKDLLRSVRAENSAFRLHDAQHQLAQEYGFASWPKLKLFVAERVLSRLADAEAVAAIEDGIRQGRQADKARALLALRPELIQREATVALVALDLEAVARLVSPDRIREPIGGRRAAPVIYAAFSPLAAEQPERHLDVLRWLLDQGADVNTTYTDPDYPDWPLSILYASAGVARSEAATRLLLERGANPRDNESVYHATESRDHSCLKLLLEAGAYNPGSNEFVRMLDFEDMEGLELMLRYDMDLYRPNALIHAMRRGRSAAILLRLIEAGADPNREDEHGVSAARVAYERGIELPGASFEPSPADELLSCCWRGDVAGASSRSDAYASLSPVQRKSFTDACWMGRAETVDAFLAGGFGWEDRDDSRGTPLHCAAFVGSVSTVEALLRHGPPLDDRKDMYNATPLMWAIHASTFGAYHEPSKGPKRDYAGVVRVLIAAGSPAPAAGRGDDAVREALRAAWPELPEEDS
jgi:ankyrin repeat protein